MNASRNPSAGDAPVTTAERVVTAFLSAIAALGTIAFFGFVILLQAGDVSSGTFWWTFLYGSVAFIVVAAVVGFAVGPKRAAEYWGLVWGTEDPEKHRGPMITILLIVIVVCLIVLLK